MPEVNYDEIPLTDERKVRAVIKRLAVPLVELKLQHLCRNYWERHLFIDRRTYCFWRDKKDVWLTPFADKGVLHRVVISGLKDEKEAKLLRSEAWRFRIVQKQVLSADALEQLANEVSAKRPERDYQETFQLCLKRLRYFFKWEGDEIVEGEGWQFPIPISQMGLRDEDVDLLRRVYAAIPRTHFNLKEHYGLSHSLPSISLRDEPCLLCGGEGTKVEAKVEAPLRQRRAARAEIAKTAKGSVSNRDLMEWINARLTDADKPRTWTQPKVLYADYTSFLADEGRRPQTSEGQRRESQAAVMSTTMWGKHMGKMFAKRKDGKKGHWYNVRLKKR